MKLLRPDISITVCLLCLNFIVCCGSARADDAPVVASIKPLHSLVQGVLGDTGRAALISSASPHDTVFRPSQMQTIRRARIIFYVDDRLEPSVTKALTVLPDTIRTYAVAQTAGLTLLPQRSDYSHASSGETKGENGYTDPHVWLDIGNAEKIVKALASELSVVFPENRSVYKANADRLTQRLRRLDDGIRARLQVVRDRPFIVFHEAYHYFEHRYGLNNAGFITLNPGISPSIKRLNAIRAQINESGALCVFHEPQFPDAVIDVVSEGSSIRKGALDPIGLNMPTGADMYFRLLDQLARSLARCLGDDRD